MFVTLFLVAVSKTDLFFNFSFLLFCILFYVKFLATVFRIYCCLKELLFCVSYFYLTNFTLTLHILCRYFVFSLRLMLFWRHFGCVPILLILKRIKSWCLGTCLQKNMKSSWFLKKKKNITIFFITKNHVLILISRSLYTINNIEQYLLRLAFYMKNYLFLHVT